MPPLILSLAVHRHTLQIVNLWCWSQVIGGTPRSCPIECKSTWAFKLSMDAHPGQEPALPAGQSATGQRCLRGLPLCSGALYTAVVHLPQKGSSSKYRRCLDPLPYFAHFGPPYYSQHSEQPHLLLEFFVLSGLGVSLLFPPNQLCCYARGLLSNGASCLASG